MKFKKDTRRKPIEYEKDLVNYWKQNKTFEKSVSSRPESNSFVFYDGPPFITGVPHHGTLLTSVVKDAVPRFWTMKGKRVERVWGWDCHGLPAEVFTEQKLGIQDRRDIGTKVSLEEYIKTCRENMIQTGSLWEDTIDRIGRWVDFQGAYKTMDKEYMESVWWAFKQLYDKGKIYEGEKVLMYCVRDATPVSKAEVAMDNSYQEVTDPSVYAKFKLADQDAYLLVWTTVAWTLFANTALVVNRNFEYVEIQLEDGQKYILAKDLLDKALRNDKNQVLSYRILRTLKGEELIGSSYEPFYKDWGEGAHRIHHADFVTLGEGTGIVSQAPAYGEEDYQTAQKEKFPVVSVIDDSGILTETDYKGQQIWEANKQIAKDLAEQGKILRIEYYRHSYPHCHRCGTKLIYRAHPSWFMDIDGQRSEMLEENSSISWFPGHIKRGRSEKTIQSAPDWNLSRDRFWATAMPVWKGIDDNGNEHIRIVGSYSELKELSGVELEDYHRPWIDDVTFTIDSVLYKRIDKVLDCWFESGSMPFAQFHYPFKNVQKFEDNFPGDFIVEYVPQVRAWFYYMNAVSIGLFGKAAFKTALVHGTIAGNDGRKMSKSLGNYTDPNELMDTYSADALRFLFLSSPLLNGEDYAMNDKDVADIGRKLSMVWNMYDFFTLYAEVDKWEWNGKGNDPTPELNNVLDQWIVTRVHQLAHEVDEHMERYDLANAVKPILPFIDDASNWYVRRSRKRFWKSDNDDDKNNAYRTLHYVLTQLSLIMAPFTPFLAEELYQKLTGGESVHLLNWPEVGHINEQLVDRMAVLRKFISSGLEIRAKQGIKVRQPLSMAKLEWSGDLGQELLDIAKDELNVKQIEFTTLEEGNHQIHLVTELTDELKREGLAREVIRQVQNARKQAGLDVDDRIILELQSSDDGLNNAVEQFQQDILGETLASKSDTKFDALYEAVFQIDARDLQIRLQRL